MKKILIILLISTLFTTYLFAEGLGNAKSLSLGDAYHSKATGFHALNWNPARLGLLEDFYTFNIFHADGRISNNSLSLKTYNETTGDSLSHSEKLDLYDLIPTSGLTLYGNSQAFVPISSFSIGKFGFTINNQNVGYFTLPKELFKLLLFGNDIEEEFDFSDTDAKILSYVEPKIGYGSRIYPEKYLSFYKDSYPPIYAGASVGYMIGLAYAEVEDLTSKFTVHDNGYASIDNRISLRTAGVDTSDGELEWEPQTAGRGFRGNFSLFSPINENLSVGLSFNNLFANIHWSKICKRIEMELVSDTLNIGNWDDSLAVDTTYSIEGFDQNIPVEMYLSGSYKYSDFKVFLDYVQGFGNSVLTTTTPKISLGSEYYALDWLPLRCGVGFGGREGTHFSFGTGFEFGRFEFNWAVRSHHGLFYGSRGLSAATDLTLKF